MATSLTEAVLVVHFLWAVWMILGVVLAVAGYRWHRLWRWRVFRITHLLGLLGTATVPVWGAGLCPLTSLEWRLRTGGHEAEAIASQESFVIRILEDVLYLEVDPLILSLVTAAGAIVTVVICILHPPWR